MTRETLIIAFRFFFLILVQTLILNNIYLFGYINPNLYLLFIFLYPLKKERGNFLFVAFLFGLCIDIFSNSGGINTAATVAIAYLRLPLLKLILNTQDLDYKLFKINQETLPRILVFIGVLTFIHHFILFGMEYFSFNEFSTILYKTFTTSIFTILLCTLSVYFTKKSTISNF
tara:strand:- start:14376 stop:14894 length:519 start_codon:yes stop_codon:yes gene_type:complete